MSNKEIEMKVQELQELKRMKEELQAEIDMLEDTIKDTMGDTEEMIVGAFKVLYQTITSTRFDSASLKKDMPELIDKYSKTTTTRRFTIK